MDANDNPALNIEDSSTNGTICTRESESMCGSSLHAAVCVHDISGSCDLGAMGADNSKPKNIGENQKISAPDGNLLNPHLNPTCTHAEKTGPITDKKAASVASRVVPLPGVLSVKDFRKVNPEFFGQCDVCSVHPAAYRDYDTYTSLCLECYERLVREENVRG
jgi:hypothetical protein